MERRSGFKALLLSIYLHCTVNIIKVVKFFNVYNGSYLAKNLILVNMCTTE